MGDGSCPRQRTHKGRQPIDNQSLLGVTSQSNSPSAFAMRKTAVFLTAARVSVLCYN